MKRILLPVTSLFLLFGCATVKMYRVNPEWDTTHKSQVKRLLVLTQPLPDGSLPAGELFSLVARRYVNQKRNFLVKEQRASANLFELPQVCGEGIEGVLWLQPDLKRVGSGVEGSLFARLVRCTDGLELWAAEAGGSFPSHDDKLTEVTQQYQSELGDEVAPYVAPAFNLLRPVLDTLPDTVLTEEEVSEKIELGE